MSTQNTFKALADPTRREILKLLASGSMSAGELADKFAISKPSLSHHFTALKQADLVRTRREGQNIIYTLNTSVLEDTARFVVDLFSQQSEADAEQTKPTPSDEVST